MVTPIQMLMLICSDLLYSSVFPCVKIPYMVIITPKILNINPIGILISNPISISSYQNNIVNTIQTMPTIEASTTGLLYHSATYTFSRGVNE